MSLLRLRHRHAFTLIKFLVVIGIIAILTAILFPLFAQAREKARQASCASNQKQWSTAILMYTNDYDETYPLSMSFDPSAQTRFTGIHDTPANWRLVNTAQIAHHSSFWVNAILTYMKTPEVAYCPSGEEFEMRIRIIPIPERHRFITLIPTMDCCTNSQ